MAGDPEQPETEITQPTQPAHAAPAQDPDYLAALIPVIYSESRPPDPLEPCKLRDDPQQKVLIGRARKCDIVVKDERCSRQHLQVSRDGDLALFVVKQLGANGSWVNDNRLHEGETRALCHGDQISLVNPPHSSAEGAENKAFAVFVFRETSPQEMMAPAVKRRRICQEGFDPGATVPGGPGPCQAKEPGSINDENLVSEEDVRSRWDLRTLLGKGSFSEVRLGIRVAGGQRQAVKVVNRSGFESFQSSRRSRLNLVSEAKLLLSLDHPGVVKCSEWFQTTTSLYLVMELVEGGDLLKNIINNGEFCEDHARRLFRDISEAVAYLHSRDVVHRDLKPDNVLLTNEDRSRCAPKLADLGLAQLNARSTDSRTFCGTPHYFAPEVIRQWQSSASAVDDTPGYGKKVDIWSLGVLLYVVLSGSPPFEDEGLYEQILQGRYEFDAEEWGSISAEAKNLVGSLMTVDCKNRLQARSISKTRQKNNEVLKCMAGVLRVGFSA
ncbi:fhkE [Symbiodinium sp. CCMP2592]|nr:fhkE [Symbiodinium sp. CCMP2592]